MVRVGGILAAELVLLILLSSSAGAGCSGSAVVNGEATAALIGAAESPSAAAVADGTPDAVLLQVETDSTDLARLRPPSLARETLGDSELSSEPRQAPRKVSGESGRVVLAKDKKSKSGKGGKHRNSFCPSSTKLFGGFRPSLKVTMVSARNLPYTDIFDKADGYVRFCVVFSEDEPRAKSAAEAAHSCFRRGVGFANTHTVKNSANPVWDFGCRFSWPEGARYADVAMEIYDDDSGVWPPWPDDFLGYARAVIPLKAFTAKTEQTLQIVTKGGSQVTSILGSASIRVKAEVDRTAYVFPAMLVFIMVFFACSGGVILCFMMRRPLVAPARPPTWQQQHHHMELAPWHGAQGMVQAPLPPQASRHSMPPPPPVSQMPMAPRMPMAPPAPMVPGGAAMSSLQYSGRGSYY